jgi:hypothetical protein
LLLYKLTFTVNKQNNKKKVISSEATFKNP